VLAIATMIITAGWVFGVEWATGRLANGWPATTPWAATLFATIATAVLVPGHRDRGGVATHLRVGLLAATGATASALMLQTALGGREVLETLILSGSLRNIGGTFPGMPSVQTLTTVIALSTAGVLLERGVLPRTRTILLTTGLLMGFSGGLETVLKAVTGGFGSAYGYSILTATMSTLTALAITSLAPRAAPAVILRARPVPTIAVLTVGAIITTPAIALLVAAVEEQGSPVDAIQGVTVFAMLALGISWLAWFAMHAETWREVARSGTDGVVVLNREGRIESVDDGTVELTGWRAEEIIGLDVTSLVGDDETDLGRLIQEAADTMIPANFDHHPFGFEGARGRVVEVSVRLLPTIMADGVRVIATLKDAALEVEYRRRSLQDPLTGVLNRRGILIALDDALDDSPIGTAVMFVDLDHFKDINDRASHAAGDEALRHVAASLQRSVRSQDQVGRFGGDEFVCVLRDITSDEDLIEIANRLALELGREDVQSPTGRISVTASIGAAAAKRHCSSDSLLARADAALLEAKRAGRDRIVIACDARAEPDGALLNF
jgi:diguanylate cyclase (GGDEF)-like protein/PAS domain S-box-containing protein